MMFLEFLYYFFKICGLATIYVDSKCLEITRLKNSTFSYCKLSIFYNFLLMVFMSVMSFFSVNYIFNCNLSWMVKFDKLFQIIQVFSLLLSTITILVLFCYKQKEMIKITEKLIMIVHTTMKFCDKKTNYSAANRTVKTVFFLSIIIWSLTITTVTIKGPIEHRFGIAMTSFFVNWVLVQYSIILILIYYVLRTMNSHFKRIFEKPKLKKNITFQLDNEPESSFFKLRMGQFFHLRLLYLSLYSVIKDLSNFYAVPLMLSIYCIFLSLTLYIYWSAKAVLFQVSHNVPIMSFIYTWIWIIVLIFTLLVVTKSASATVTEVPFFNI